MTELETKTGAEATEQFTEATDGLADEALDREGGSGGVLVFVLRSISAPAGFTARGLHPL